MEKTTGNNYYRMRFANIVPNLILLILFGVMLIACNNNEALLQQKKHALMDASNRRVEKVIAELKADCDSNLLKETYKRVQQQRKRK